MDIEAIADSVLKQYNSEKEKNGKADFRKIISKHYKVGIFSGTNYTDFFNSISKKCHELQPGRSKVSRKLGDKLHKAQNIILQTGVITTQQVERDYHKKIRQLGNGRYEEGLEYYEKIMFE